MNELKSIFLTLITENQAEIMLAEDFGVIILNELGEGWEIEKIAEYPKFLNSWKIEFKRTYKSMPQADLNNLAIELTDKLVSPWLIYFYEDEKTIELIYNNDENTQKRRLEYQVIKWGHLQMMNHQDWGNSNRENN